MSDGIPQPSIKEKIYDFVRVYGQKLDITMTVHFLIYFITLFLFPRNEIFINMLTIDSTISAIQFIKTIDEDKDDIINRCNMNKIYEADLLIRKSKEYIETKYPKYLHYFDFNNEGYVNVIKKYLFYGIMQVLSWLFGMVFWGYGVAIFNAILLLLAIPIFYITIISSQFFLKLFKIATTCFKSIGVFILSKITAKIINNLAETCIGTSPKIDYNEMIEYYEDFGNTVDGTFVFLKTVSVQTLVYYFKKTDNIFYYYLVEIFHKYQIEALMSQSSGETADNKSKIIYEIVKTRKWGEFLKPKTVNMIFELYENKNNDMYARRMGVFFRNIGVNGKRFMFILAIAIYSPFFAICIDIIYTFFKSRYSMTQHYLTYAIGACVLYSNNYILGAILLILSEIITKPIIDYVDEKELLSKYVIQSKDQAIYLILIPAMWKLSYFSMLIPPIAHYINRQPLLNSIMQIVTIVALLSGNNFWHIVFLFSTGLIANNLVMGVTVNPPKISINLIDDYLEGYSNSLIRKRIESLPKPNVKTIKISEEPIERPTRANVCKYVSSWVWTT